MGWWNFLLKQSTVFSFQLFTIFAEEFASQISDRVLKKPLKQNIFKDGSTIDSIKLKKALNTTAFKLKVLTTNFSPNWILMKTSSLHRSLNTNMVLLGRGISGKNLLSCYAIFKKIVYTSNTYRKLKLSKKSSKRSPKNNCSQRLIQNPVGHLRWSLFAKIVNGFQLLTIFAKKLHCRCSTGF